MIDVASSLSRVFKVSDNIVKRQCYVRRQSTQFKVHYGTLGARKI